MSIFGCIVAVLLAFWLLIHTAFLAAKGLKKFAPEFYRRHIADTFPEAFPQECFACNRGSCAGCRHMVEVYRELAN